MDLTRDGSELLSWVFILVMSAASAWAVRRAGRWVHQREAAERQLREQEEAKKAERDRKRKLVTDWGSTIAAVSQSSNYNYDAIMAVGPPPDGARKYYYESGGSDWYTERGKTPYGIFENVSEWPQKRDELLTKYESDDPFTALDALEQIGKGTFPYTPRAEYVFGLGADRGWLQGRCDEKLAELVSRISELDYREAKRMFKKLQRRLVQKRTRVYFGSQFKNTCSDYVGELRLNLPDEWNDLVAMFIRTPELEDFSPAVRKYSEAEVLQLATQAVNERSLTKAKLVLAYAQLEKRQRDRYLRNKRRYTTVVWLPYREIVGDTLIGELSNLVEELHDEQRLFTNGSSK